MFRRQTLVTLILIATVGGGVPAAAEPPPGNEWRVPRAVEQTVEIQLLDHDGAPARTYALIAYDLATGASRWLYDASGTVTAELPEGRYLLYAHVSTDRPGGSVTTHFAEPGFAVDGYTTQVLDSRLGRPLDVRVDEPNAREGTTTLEFLATTPAGVAGMRSAGSTGFDDTLVAPSATTAPEFRFGVETELAEPDGNGGFADSPYLYHIRWGENGRVPADLERSFPDTGLATVLSEHAVETEGLYGVRDGMVSALLPFALTEHYTPDVPWETRFTEAAIPNSYERSSTVSATPRVYRAGQVTRERWNTGVFGPAFPAHEPAPESFAPYVSERQGDRFEFRVPMFTDRDPARMGNTGTVSSATGTTELLRDGTVLQTSNQPGDLIATVAPEAGTYTLRTSAQRKDFRLSTDIRTEWTFPSAHTAKAEPVPLMAVRFAPDLDLHNTAPAGRFRMPVYVQRNGSGVVGHRPSVEVSYDDGATWRTARVLADRAGWSVLLNHPAGAEFVSLRATAADGAGSGTTQTILRAYALR